MTLMGSVPTAGAESFRDFLPRFRDLRYWRSLDEYELWPWDEERPEDEEEQEQETSGRAGSEFREVGSRTLARWRFLAGR